MPAEVTDFYKGLQAQGAKKEEEFNALFATYEVWCDRYFLFPRDAGVYRSFAAVGLP